MKLLILVVIGFVTVYSADGFNLFGREENNEINDLSVGLAHRAKSTIAPEVTTTKKAAQKKTQKPTKKPGKKPSAKKPFKKPGKKSSKKSGKKNSKKNNKKNKKNKTVKPFVSKLINEQVKVNKEQA